MSCRTTGSDSQPQRSLLHNIDTVLLKFSILQVGNVALVQKKLRAANKVRMVFYDRLRTGAAGFFIRHSKQDQVSFQRSIEALQQTHECYVNRGGPFHVSGAASVDEPVA